MFLFYRNQSIDLLYSITCCYLNFPITVYRILTFYENENFVKVASTKKQWNKIHERCYGVCFVGEVLIIFSGTL